MAGVAAIEGAARLAFRPPDLRHPWQWAEENVRVDPTSPFQGLWSSALSPWAREVMEVFPDNEIKEISIMCAAQSAKTQTMICMICWALNEDPSTAMWVTSTNDEANYFFKTRLTPTLRTCKPLADQLQGRHSITKLEVSLPAASLIVTGSSSPSKLQAKPVRWLFLDEVRNYPQGALEMALKRTRAYWNSRTLVVSTADTENDAVHRAYLAGDQGKWAVPCPACSKFHLLLWDQIRYDSGEEMRDEDGNYDFDSIADTIRWACPACGHEGKDEPVLRRLFADGGKFISQNPKAPRGRRSFHWNALLPTWVRWRDLVEEWVLAQHAMRRGDISPLKDFINESLGEPWEDRLGVVEESDALLQRRGEYQIGEDWDEEVVRFMGVDKQAKGGTHYWWCIRAFANEGAESRLIDYGKVYSETELLEIAESHKVQSRFCLMDCGYDYSTVLKFCHTNGWRPFRGDAQKQFRAKDESGRVVRQIWSSTSAYVDFGTKAHRLKRSLRIYLWSNPSVKDLLQELIMGMVGKWTLPQDVDSAYVKQLTAEVRVEMKDAKGRVGYEWRKIRKDDHLRDCESMIIVAALATRKLGIAD